MPGMEHINDTEDMTEVRYLTGDESAAWRLPAREYDGEPKAHVLIRLTDEKAVACPLDWRTEPLTREGVRFFDLSDPDEFPSWSASDGAIVVPIYGLELRGCIAAFMPGWLVESIQQYHT